MGMTTLCQQLLRPVKGRNHPRARARPRARNSRSSHGTKLRRSAVIGLGKLNAFQARDLPFEDGNDDERTTIRNQARRLA
jgi:hypothetical protein